MSEQAIKDIVEHLYDDNYRSEYGASIAKYDLAVAISEARRSKNLTQEQLAKASHLSQAYIAKLESGEANPTIGQIGRILASIGLRLDLNYKPLIPKDIKMGPGKASTEVEDVSKLLSFAEKRGKKV